MTVYESDLPGVGKKYEVELDDGSRLVIVIHHTGKREVYRRPDPDSDSDKLFELSDQLARQVGTLLEGAYFQPVRTDEIETVLDGNTLLEWVEVPGGSPIAGKTLAESNLRQEMGASVIAIKRDERVIAPPGGETMVRAGDTLVVIGPKEVCREFADYVEGE
jgi:TrkA domain protein